MYSFPVASRHHYHQQQQQHEMVYHPRYIPTPPRSLGSSGSLKSIGSSRSGSGSFGSFDATGWAPIHDPNHPLFGVALPDVGELVARVGMLEKRNAELVAALQASRMSEHSARSELARERVRWEKMEKVRAIERANSTRA